MNERYYWDEENQQILYATPSVTEGYPGSSEAGNDVWVKDGVVYLNVNFIKKFLYLFMEELNKNKIQTMNKIETKIKNQGT